VNGAVFIVAHGAGCDSSGTHAYMCLLHYGSPLFHLIQMGGALADIKHLQTAC